jgi:hypothetical protein
MDELPRKGGVQICWGERLSPSVDAIEKSYEKEIEKLMSIGCDALFGSF